MPLPRAASRAAGSERPSRESIRSSAVECAPSYTESCVVPGRGACRQDTGTGRLVTRKRRSGDMPYTRRTDPGLGKRGGTCSASPRNCGTRVHGCRFGRRGPGMRCSRAPSDSPGHASLRRQRPPSSRSNAASRLRTVRRPSCRASTMAELSTSRRAAFSRRSSSASCDRTPNEISAATERRHRPPSARTGVSRLRRRWLAH